MNLGMTMIFFWYNTEVLWMKKIIHRLDFIIIKKFCSVRDTVKRLKR